MVDLYGFHVGKSTSFMDLMGMDVEDFPKKQLVTCWVLLRLEGDAPGVGWPHGSTADIVSPWLGCFDIGNLTWPMAKL